jgi:hypothetical protein
VAIDRNQDSGPVEVAVDEDLNDGTPQDDAADSEEPSLPTTVAPTASRVGGEELMVEGPHGVIFDGERFVSLGHGPYGPSILTSDDGLDWTTTKITGLPGNAYVNRLVEHEGVFAVIGEQWDEATESGPLFGPSAPTFYLGYSSDLENWTFTEIPVASSDDSHPSVSGFGFTDAGVFVITQKYPTGPDEVRLLFEADILTETQLRNYCGLNFDPGDRIEVRLCTYDEEQYEETDDGRIDELEERWLAAETDDERDAIEAEIESMYHNESVEVIAVIEPGSQLHSELFALYHTESYGLPEGWVLSGPLDGPFTSSPLPFEGHIGNVIQVQDQHFVVVGNERGATTLFTTTDGADWSEISMPVGAEGEVWGGGNVLLLRTYSENGTSLFTSHDAGASWETADIPTSLFNTYPEVTAGSAGLVAVVNGAVEPVDYPEPQAITVTRDGYSFTTNFAGEEEESVLTGPDGEVIYTLTPEEMYSDDSDKVRRTPFSGTPVFLDPDTGGVLVSFRPEDFEAAYSELERAEYVEPDYATEAFFSTDGSDWVRLEDPDLTFEATGHLSLIAVGDAEAIFARHVGPPAELFGFEEEGRDPTAQELDALEQWEMQPGGRVQYIRVELP